MRDFYELEKRKCAVTFYASGKECSRAAAAQLTGDPRTRPPAGQARQEAVACPHPLSSLHVLKQPLENRAREIVSNINVYMLEGEMLLNTKPNGVI